MTAVGAEMINPVTKERFVWRHTAASTGGAFVEFDLFLDGGAAVAAAHTHPYQEERFTVESGQVAMRIGRDRRVAGAGEEIVVSRGTAHTWSNGLSAPTHVRVRVTPALRIEDYFETFCGLARDGKAARSGLPRNPLQLAVLVWAHRREFALPTAAGRLVLTPMVGLLAAIGRCVGFRDRYPEYSSD
jgi:quercetin dioxygenase-like cupin family protein